MQYNNNQRRRSLLMTSERKKLIEDILNEVNKNVVLSKIYSNDLDRLNKSDWWVLSFALAHKEDLHVTSAVIQECLKWRKSYDIYSIRFIDFINSPEQINVYIRGEDAFGNKLLWIKMNEHKSNDRTIDRLLIYWLETNLLYYNYNKLTVVIDMTDAKTMDNTLIRFMLHCFKYNYPNCLEKTIIYNPPPKLNATIHLFQSWLADYELPMAHEITDKHHIYAFIRAEHLPYHMNGTDKFEMDDIAKCAPSNLLPNGEQIVNEHVDTAVRPSIDEVINAKRVVRFEDSIEMAPSGSRNNSVQRKGHIPHALKSIYDEKKSNHDNWYNAGFLRVSPKEHLTFKQLPDEKDFVDLIIIGNHGGYGIQFKIKTTSPEKFRVRPSFGFVSPGESDFIRIYLQQEYKETFKNEKFLLMAVKTNDDNLDNFGLIWKSAIDSEKFEKQFRCIVDIKEEPNEVSEQHTITSSIISMNKKAELELNAENAELRQKIGELGQKQMLIIFMLLFLLVIHMLTVVQLRSAIEGLADSIKENHSGKFHSDL